MSEKPMSAYDLFEVWMRLQEKMQQLLNDKVYEVWIRPLTPLDLSGGTCTVAVYNEFFKKIFEQKYAGLVEQQLSEILGQPARLVLEKMDEPEAVPSSAAAEKTPAAAPAPVPAPVCPAAEQAAKPAMTAEKPSEEYGSSNLNPRYVFETFVIGNSNRLAWAAAQQVAEKPGMSYNPLFIWGGVGLGKTHLMHAIGNKILQKNASARVIYITSEQFTNEIVNSIYNKTTESFRSKYRSIDCLIIDDIQFLKGKEQTQVEFFHTFNTLYEANKQIIISSDRKPQEIETLQDRLSDRFSKGMMTDIQPPDLETRMAILRQKAAADGIELPGEVVTLLAANVTTNIRQIEGAYTRLKALHSLMNMPLDANTAQQVLDAIGISEQKRQLTVGDIVNAVAQYYGVSREELFNKKRTQNIAYPRQIAMYMCRELADMSYPKIGEAFGGRDHTTVIHAYEKISANRKSDLQLAGDLEKMQELLK